MNTFKFCILIIAINLSLNCNRDTKNANTTIVKNELTSIDTNHLFWNKVLERYSPDISDYYPYIVTWQKGDSTITYHLLSYSKDSLEIAHLSNCSIFTSNKRITMYFKRMYKFLKVDSCFKNFNLTKIESITIENNLKGSQAFVNEKTGETFLTLDSTTKFIENSKEIEIFYKSLKK